MVVARRADLLQGTLDLLILRILQFGDMHGWGITERIERISNEVLQVGQGSLYPALYRLERQGAIRSYWGVSDNNRRARFYAVTTKGKPRFAQERAEWRRLATAIELVLTATTA